MASKVAPAVTFYATMQLKWFQFAYARRSEIEIMFPRTTIIIADLVIPIFSSYLKFTKCLANYNH